MGTTLDHELLADVFGTAAMRQAFDARATVQAWLDVERALAESEADVGEIPAEAAKRIAQECDASRFDLAGLARQVLLTGHPLVPLIRELVKRSGEHGAFVHWGTTTQDIVDTGLMLQCRQGLALIEADVSAAIADLLRHAVRYRDTPMAGRTHLQHAAPITFGYKLSVWTDELLRVHDRLSKLKAELFGQLAGAVGSLASLDQRGAAIRDNFCRRLGLKSTPVPWQTSRDRVREIMYGLTDLSIAAERVALEVIRLQATELGEASEPISAHHVGSSTMPQKRNPHTSEFVAAGCKLLRGACVAVLDSGVHAFERDMGVWAVEWIAVPQAFILAAGIAHNLRHIAAGLVVDAKRMAKNLAMTQGQIMAESVMMQLAQHLGHEHAHEIVTVATREASERNVHLGEVLKSSDELRALTPRQIDDALDPARYLGHCAATVDAVVAMAKARGIIADAAA
jgi:3-carboxy-cis,cis-muconate cycloisomerase